MRPQSEPEKEVNACEIVRFGWPTNLWPSRDSETSLLVKSLHLRLFDIWHRPYLPILLEEHLLIVTIDYNRISALIFEKKDVHYNSLTMRPIFTNLMKVFQATDLSTFLIDLSVRMIFFAKIDIVFIPSKKSVDELSTWWMITRF